MTADEHFGPSGYAILMARQRNASLTADEVDSYGSWSAETFGPGARTDAVVDHITKEVNEILAAPDDIEEWIDVVILAMDGAMRAGADARQIIGTIRAKHAKNRSRTWPDWRTADPDKAIEHVRSYVDEYRDGAKVA